MIVPQILSVALISLAVWSQDQASPSPSIRWEVDPLGTTSSVSVVGLSAEILKKLEDPAWPAEGRVRVFSIAIEAGPRTPDLPSMLGTYRVEGGAFRFIPRYPLDRGRTYSAKFRPALLPGGSGPEVISSRSIPKPATVPTVVSRVTPSADQVPENLLKFYLFFSAPMRRGEVYDRVRLLKADGQAVDLPFLRLAEELWDPTGTRLTLLIDPGRIKRGLKPREENGPVLEAGKTYTLVIDRGWPDAEGISLSRDHRKTFRAEAPSETQPDPKSWKVASPSSLSLDPLTVTFPRPLDRALIESSLTLMDSRGEKVAGKISVGPRETRWEFTPEARWVAGNYELLVDADLEDLAGNSILRPFEVDIQRDTPSRPEGMVIRMPISIRPKNP